MGNIASCAAPSGDDVSPDNIRGRIACRSGGPASDDDLSLDDIQGLKPFCKRYPDIADESRLRWWIFHRKSNGLEASGAVLKKNGRWFIVVPRMKTWILQAA